jgi:predicted AlkP superfamily phosphohydrolase/phosphomutase/tetratricopeptide (TPR) repeat protein
MPEALAKKVLLIGWDAADWKIINPLLDQGLMPTLENFVNHGVMGNLATLQPVLSPMLWNSIATGKRPDKHGILGFIEPDPLGGGVRPATSTSRKVKAIWNILTQGGYKTHALGWFASHPAEPINGISVSDLYPHAAASFENDWPLPPHAVHPPEMRETFAALRMHPSEVTEAAILPWIPRAGEIDQEKDRRLETFAKILAENCTIHNAAARILEHEPWDFLAVYYNGIDHFCHAFMHFHPPRMEGVPEHEFEIYKDVVTGAYRFHDMMLQRLLELAGQEATVLLVSDHGFHSDHLRPRGIPNEPAGAAVQHRQFGILCMKGTEIKQDERIYGATLLDVTPTILTLFGLPVGADMDGRVLVQAFEQLPEITRIPSWEQEAGECGMHPPDLGMDAVASQALMQRFVDLGYIEAPTEDQKRDQTKARDMAVREQQYNLALTYMNARRYREALPLLEQLAMKWPDQARFSQWLAQCYLALQERAKAKTILEELVSNPPNVAQTKAKTDAAKSDASRGPVGDTGVGVGSEQAGELSEVDDRPWADLMMAIVHFEDGDMDEALARLLRAERSDPRLPDLHLRIGDVYLRKKRIHDAQRAYQRALEIDGDSSGAYLGLAITHLRKRENEEAAERALQAVGLLHFLPLGHFYLGVALARLGHRQRAALAFETCLTMLPGLIVAHRWLAALYQSSNGDGDPEKAAQHRAMYRQMRSRAVSQRFG